MERIEIDMERHIDTIEVELRDKAIPIYPELENITITPTNERQTFTHENSYGYDVVIVEAGGQSRLQEKEIEPSIITREILPDEDYDGFSKIIAKGVTSDIDENIVSSNIKKDTSILGVVGSLVEYQPPIIENETLVFLSNASVEGESLVL